MAELTPSNDTADNLATKPKPSGEKRRKIRRWLNRVTWAFIILAPLVYAVAAIGYKLGLFDLGFAFGTLNQKLGLVMLANAEKRSRSGRIGHSDRAFRGW